jgi:hypothetical protein
VYFFVCFNYLKSLNSHVFVYNLAFKLLAIFFLPHACADVFPRCFFPPEHPIFSLAAQMRMRCQAVDQRWRDDASKERHQRRNEGLPTMHCVSLLFTITIFNKRLAKSCWNTLRFWLRLSCFFEGMFLYLYYLRP